MYSWEITQTIEHYNYNLPSYLYLDMTSSSPQINHVAYMADNNHIEMWDKEGCHWYFKVYYYEAS